jgi:citrate lyase subunit beta/citryl-CoA lyase
MLRARLDQVGQGGLPVIGGIETARGVTRLERILAEAAPDAVYFGAEDLAADVNGIRTDQGLEVLYARSHIALYARAAGVPCIDQVVVRLDDDELFERDASTGRALGYQGKMCLHPRQVPLAKRAFRPSPEEVAAARRVVAAYASEAATGGGVIRLDGEMVDEPMVRRARHLLASIESEETSADDQG